MAVGRLERQVHAEERQPVRLGGEDVLVQLRPHGHGGRGRAQYVEERDEDRELHHQRQAPAERVHLVLLVELHHLFVELLAIALVLRLELLDLRLQSLHRQHGAGRLRGEREQDEHHGDRQQDDRHALVRDDGVEERQDGAEGVVEGIKHRSACSHGRTCVRGDGIEAAAAPRMAAPQPADR